MSISINTHLRFAEWVLVLLALLELTFLALVRSVNLDEGWYLWASKLVYEGQWLYRDFAYTQTPLLPYVYGLFQSMFGEGLYQGRTLTVGFTLTTWLLSVASARRLGEQWAALGCLALLLTSFFATAQYTYTATYAFTACLLALAVCVRLSTILALPPFLIYLIFTSRKRRQAMLWVILTATLTLTGVLGLFWLVGGELFWYDIWGFHTDRLLRVDWQRLRMQSSIMTTLTDFGVPVLLTLMGAGWAVGKFRQDVRWNQGKRDGDGQGKHRQTSDQLFVPATLVTGTLLAIAGMVIGLFVAHLAPRTTDSYYNALQLPLMSVAGGVVLARWLTHFQTSSRRILAVGAVFALLALNSGLQARALGRDRLVPLPLQNQIATVRTAARLLQRHTQRGDTLLGFNPHLALEAGLRVPPGYEMAIFAYRPTWTSEQATLHRVVSNERLILDLAQGDRVAAFSTFDLEMIYGERDGFFQALGEHYRWAYRVPHFGSYGNTLHIYLPPQFALPIMDVAMQTHLADGITLLGYTWQKETAGNEKSLQLALYWQATQPPTQAYTVFAQLLDQTGKLAVGQDSPPCWNTCPTSTWRRGEFVRDEHTLPLAGLDLTLPYTLQVGLYDASGARLTVVSGDAQIGGDSIVLTTLTLAQLDD
ncbi:MAG: hypothetical protein M3Q45_15500 [Chloroflexota bacterium]|nr:hypothetical protein [Chloroflexota bacterium]